MAIIGNVRRDPGRASRQTYEQGVTLDDRGQIQNVRGYEAAQLGDPTDWRVDNQQTVRGQLTGVIADNSPIIQQAHRDALNAANARGLMNSSMAVTAGQRAVYDTALPIAQADAQTFARSAAYNADARNQFAVRNQQALNEAAMFGADAANRIGMTNAQTMTQRYGIDTDAAVTREGHGVQRYGIDTQADTARRGQDVQRYGIDTDAATARRGQDVQRYGIDTDAGVRREDIRTRRDLGFADIDVRRELGRGDLALRRDLGFADIGVRRELGHLDASVRREDIGMRRELGHADIGVRRELGHLDANTRRELGYLDAATRERVSHIEGKWRATIQQNANAAELYKQFAANMVAIETSDNLNSQGKRNAINAQEMFIEQALQGINDWTLSGSWQYFGGYASPA